MRLQNIKVSTIHILLYLLFEKEIFLYSTILKSGMIEISDYYDRTIIETLIALDTKSKKQGRNPMSPVGENELARILEGKMSYKTALNHIHKLINQGYLINLIEEINKKYIQIEKSLTSDMSFNATKLSNLYVIDQISQDIAELIKKRLKTKMKLILNFDKLEISTRDSIKTSTSLPLFHSEELPENRIHR